MRNLARRNDARNTRHGNHYTRENTCARSKNVEFINSHHNCHFADYQFPCINKKISLDISAKTRGTITCQRNNFRKQHAYEKRVSFSWTPDSGYTLAIISDIARSLISFVLRKMRKITSSLENSLLRFPREKNLRTYFSMKTTGWINFRIFSASVDLFFKACAQGEDAREWGPAVAGGRNGGDLERAWVILLNLL